MEATDKKLLKVLRGETVTPPPIWLMRQAGRYLPEYKETRAHAGGFLDLVDVGHNAWVVSGNLYAKGPNIKNPCLLMSGRNAR